MKRTLSFFFAAGLTILAGSVFVHADIARPKPSPTSVPVARLTEMSVEPSANASQARLQISQKMFESMKAQIAGLPSDQSTRAITHNSRRTIFAGLSLFLAISFGGIWLMRSGSNRNQKFVATGIIGLSILGAAAIITRANAGPPPTYLWRNLSQNLSTGKTTHAPVVVEIVAEDVGVKLIVPQPAKPANRADE